LGAIHVEKVTGLILFCLVCPVALSSEEQILG
jgi:hypothetical protein